MPANLSHTSQLALFDPADKPLAERAPKVTLPFQRSEEIDVCRAQKILRVSNNTVYRLLEMGMLTGYTIDRGRRTRWRIEYNSVVRFCDKLASDHGIERKPGAKPLLHGRRRDADLLPFPWDESMTVRETQQRLDCSYVAVLHLIEQGTLVGYKIFRDDRGSHWRIHEPSVTAHLRGLKCQQIERRSRASTRSR